MSLRGVIARFASGQYTVTRHAAESYVDGLLVAGSTSTFSITASVQPVTGRELQTLPEAQHGREVRVVFTTAELRTRQAGNAPDTIEIDGETWAVERQEGWNAFGGYHSRAFITRMEIP
jgi:hypothetical protein